MKQVSNAMKKFLIFLLFLCSQAVFAADIEYIHKDPNVYVFKLNTSKIGNKIKPYVLEELDTVQNVYKQNCFQFVVNGGFFDPKTAAPASYVFVDGKMTDNPYDNESLVASFESEDMEKIANRAEFRVLERNNGSLRFDITYHYDEIPKGWCLRHSLQAGPMLLPEMNLEKEHFVKYNGDTVIRDSIDALKRRARTVLGIKGDNIYVIVFAKPGMVTLSEARDYCKKMGFTKAMALDGGGSSSVRFEDVDIFSQEKESRRVKSFLVVED